MFSIFRPQHEKISSDADVYIRFYGDAAYCCAQTEERRAFLAGDRQNGERFSRIRMEIARKLDYRPNLDIPEQEILTLLFRRLSDKSATAGTLHTPFATDVWESEGGALRRTKH